MRTADDDSAPVPYGAFELPRPVLKWKPRAGTSSPADGARAPSRASNQRDELEDEPTRMMIPVLARPSERPRADQDLPTLAAALLDALLARVSKLSRARPLRILAMVAAIALITYLAVVSARREASQAPQTMRGSVAASQAAARPAAAPIIVQQLNGARPPAERTATPVREEPTESALRRSTETRARAKPLAPRPTSKSNSRLAFASVQPKAKSRRAVRSSATSSSSSTGLPAWGAEAVRDFSSGKSSKSSAREPAKPAPVAVQEKSQK